MKKLIAGVVLLLVLGTVSYFYLRPEVLMDAAPSLFASHHKTVISERAKALFNHLRRDEVDACVAFADPAELARSGTTSVRRGFGLMSGILKLGQLGGKMSDDDLRLDSVDVAPDGKTATVAASIRTAAGWGKPQTYRWVRVGSQWFITV